MRPVLNGLDFERDPQTLPGEPEAFSFLARLYVGATAGVRHESFEVTVCSPEWLRERARQDGIVSGLHHMIINVEDYDENSLRTWFERLLTSVDRETWQEVAAELSRLGSWEFEGYRP
jgi:hypothetical protein